MFWKERMTKILMTNEDIVRESKRIAKWINENYNGKKPILVGLLKGCVPFYAELIKHLEIDFETEFMVAKSYHGTASTGKLNILMDVMADVKNRDVIIVEDIVDTGLTLTKINDLFKTRGCNSFRVVTLLDKHEARTHAVDIAMAGMKIENQFVVGFGLDYNEQYRGLPYIGILNPKFAK